MEGIMAKYVDINQLFNCETCRHHKESGCNTLCENGESYSPSLTKLNCIEAMEIPCKTNSTVYSIFDHDDEESDEEKLIFEVYEGTLISFSLDENEILWYYVRYKNGLTYWHTIEDFNKRTFVEKEKAEELRKRLQEEHDPKFIKEFLKDKDD
jgi:hypothetical protein